MLSLYSDPYHIFFNQGSSATADINEDIVLRFAHGDFTELNYLHGYWFEVHFIDRYGRTPFDFRFNTNTPFPYHAELHINRAQFDYEGEYFISYDYRYRLWPNFVININSKLCMSVANQTRMVMYTVLLQCFVFCGGSDVVQVPV